MKYEKYSNKNISKLMDHPLLGFLMSKLILYYVDESSHDFTDTKLEDQNLCYTETKRFSIL